jgi:hypothetical protein
MLRDILFYMKRTSKFFRETLRFFIVLVGDYIEKKGSNDAIRVACNGYPTGLKKDWLCTFMQEHTGKQVAVSWYKPSVIFCSSFGSYWLLRILLSVYKVPSLFFSEENLTTLKKYREYKTYLNGKPSLAMGFDYCSADNYRRFPLWLLYIFPPEFAARASVDDIQKRLDQIEKQSFYPKTKFATMVASHDGYASEKKVFECLKNVSRSEITQQVATIDFVNCPGKLLHNDDSLKNEYNDDKKTYLKQFLFNICAENASVKGYVTEKLFEAIEGGTIPIYWGDVNPEPTILNPERIVFWDGAQVENVLEKLQQLYRDKDTREKFLQQPIFTKCAAQEIHDYFNRLGKDFDSLFA